MSGWFMGDRKRGGGALVRRVVTGKQSVSGRRLSSPRIYWEETEWRWPMGT